jgi:hypothetical protein
MEFTIAAGGPYADIRLPVARQPEVQRIDPT